MLFRTGEKSTFQDSSIIPLINVVFLILIFLIIAGQIKSSELFEVDLPESVSDSTPAEEVLSLIVNSQREVIFENELIDVDELSGKVAESRKDLSPDQANVLLKIDGRLMVSELRPVLAQLKSSGLQKISIATLQRHVFTD